MLCKGTTLQAAENSTGVPNPDFLYAVLDRSACAPFRKERRMKCFEATKLHRKSGEGTLNLAQDAVQNAVLGVLSSMTSPARDG